MNIMNVLKKKETRHEEEVKRLYDYLATLQPGTEEYNNVLTMLTKIRESETSINKVDMEKIDMAIKVGSIVLATFAAPLLTYGLNRSMVKYIGKVEQMEIFTSTAGKRMIPDFFKRL